MLVVICVQGASAVPKVTLLNVKEPASLSAPILVLTPNKPISRRHEVPPMAIPLASPQPAPPTVRTALFPVASAAEKVNSCSLDM